MMTIRVQSAEGHIPVFLVIRVPLKLSLTNEVICTSCLGNGGNAGSVNLRYRSLNGKLKLQACAGVGGQVAKNGAGGRGKMSIVCFTPNTAKAET